ncbi:hypothetical protein VKT23_009274 [Stygiomarasmius scandens]|uniref:Uncharacterized protein n=1 Tax=Marasmiellus scandens TaxID=2682957 RepID=A0ABR1JEW6_9AGAR
MLSSMLVSRAWLKAFFFTFSTDLVFPNVLYFDYIFLTILPGHSKVFSPSFAGLGFSPDLLINRCRSLTFLMEGNRDDLLHQCRYYCHSAPLIGGSDPLLYPLPPKLGYIQNLILGDPHIRPHIFPNAHRLAVHFYNKAPTRRECLRTFATLTPLFTDLTELEFGYTWDTEIPVCILNTFGSRSHLERLRNGISDDHRDAISSLDIYMNGWDFIRLGGEKLTAEPPTNLRKLSVYGVSEQVAMKILTQFTSCVNLVEFHSDVCLDSNWLAINLENLGLVQTEYNVGRLSETWSDDLDGRYRATRMLCLYHDRPHPRGPQTTKWMKLGERPICLDIIEIEHTYYYPRKKYVPVPFVNTWTREYHRDRRLAEGINVAN